MSQRPAPRRAIAAALLICATASLLGPGAQARDPGARSVYGDGIGHECAAAAQAGLVDDASLRSCTAAIESGDMTPADRARIYNNRGVIYLNRNDAAAALADFDQVLRFNAENGEAMVNRGAALVLGGQPGQAVAVLTRGLQLGVSAPHVAYFNRASARESLGDARGAYEDYSTALAIQPDWGPAQAELARFARSRREQLAGVVGAAISQPAPQSAPVPGGRR